MTTFTAITNAQVDQDSPITQTLITAFRDNVLAVAEQDSTAPGAAGWPRRHEELEVTTSGITALEFTEDISAFKAVYLEGVFSFTASAYVDIEIRVAAGTWRKIGRSISSGAANIPVYVRAVVENINRGDTNLVRCLGLSATGDKRIGSANNPPFEYLNDGAVVGGTQAIAGFSNHAETYTDLRFVTIGAFGDGGAASPIITRASLHGIKAVTNEATL